MRDHVELMNLEQMGNVWVAVVTFTDPANLAPYHQRLQLPFPLLADPDRVFYQSFALGRTSFRHVYNPGTLRLYAKLLRQGRKLEKSNEDTRQLGGDFIIDARGNLAKGFWPKSPDDRPPVADLAASLLALQP